MLWIKGPVINLFFKLGQDHQTPPTAANTTGLLTYPKIYQLYY
jgi:hypothetical protein